MIGRLRRDDRPPTAVHARVHDGAHLWLAVRDASRDRELLLVAPDGTEVDVPTEAEADLRVACVALPPAAEEIRLVAGRGRRASGVRLDDPRPPGPTRASPTTPDGRGRWEVGADADGTVVVRRVPVVSRVAVRRFAVVEGDVHVHLDTTAAWAVLAHEGAELARTPLEDGRLTVPVDAPVPAGAVATWEVDGVAVGRAGNLLVRPHPAVVLPPLAPPAPLARGAALELRWLPDGRLALQRTGG